MNTCNDYSVWILDRDYRSDESGHSAEYELGIRHHRLLEEAEEERDSTKAVQEDTYQGLT